MALAVLAFAATCFAISTCRNITDPAFDLRSGNYEQLSQRHKECTLKCDDQYKLDLAAALETHKLLIRGCGNDVACRRAEHERYRLAKKVIEDSKTVCKFACRYNEGAILGGK